MGMPIVLDVRDDVDDDPAESVFDWLRWVDDTFSTYKEDSEITRINRGELTRQMRIPTSPPFWSAARSSASRRAGTSTSAHAAGTGSTPPGWSRAGRSRGPRRSSTRPAPGTTRSTRAETWS